MRRTIGGIVLGALLTLPVTILAAGAPDYSFEMGHGDTMSVTCDYPMQVVSQSLSEVLLHCDAPPDSPSPSSSATATVSPTASPTVTPTPTPTPVVTPSPTPTPSSTPPPPPGGIVGYGASTVGGTGGTVTHVTSLAQLRSLVKAPGKRVLLLPTARATWDLAGSDLQITSPNVTIDGGAIIFKGAAVKVLANQVILQNLTSHPGDITGVAADVDAITINGNSACRDHVVLNHVEAIWGPDVGGITILGCVHDVTVQDSIAGEGLFRSAHPKSTDSPDGHALAFNIADNYGNPAQRVTVYNTLVTTSQGRNPRVIGGYCIDLVDNVFYNYVEGPSGNPNSLNVIGNTYKAGPAPAAAGLTMRREEWRFAKDANYFTTLIPNSTYLSGNRAVGFTFQTPADAQIRQTPACAPSVTSSGAVAAYNAVVNEAGPSIHSDQTDRLLNNVANGTGTYYNGHAFPPPNPTWP